MLIGVSGYARSGKDTVGTYLKEQYGFTVCHFAEPIKRISGEVFDFNDEQLYGGLKETPDERYRVSSQEPITPRDVMKEVGMAGRRLYPDIWAVLGMREAQQLLDEGKRVVFCDVRFPNEVVAIQSHDGYVIRLLRGKPESAHPSETSLDGQLDRFDYVLDNRFSLDALYASVDIFMAETGVAG